MDIKAQLGERFACSLDHYFGIEQADVDPVIAIFDHLCGTVDDIPAPLLDYTLKLIAFTGPDRYDVALSNALGDVGRTFTPIDAADFVTRVNLSLPFLRTA